MRFNQIVGSGVVLGILLLLIVACSGTSENVSAPYPKSAEYADEESDAYYVDEGASSFAPQEPGGGYEQAIPSSETIQHTRIIIYTGEISLIVDDTNQAVESITKLTEGVGGYVASSNMHNWNGVPRGSITIKVPAETYQDVMQQLRNFSVEVERENSNSQDVTEEFTDLEARKANLQVAESALQELLETRQKIGKTSDILEVFRELTAVREQIEQIQGRLNYLAQSAAMSTITVNLTPSVLAQPITIVGWQPSGTARQALRAFFGAMQDLVDMWLWFIIYIFPVAISYFGPPIFVLWVIWRWWRKGQKVSIISSIKSKISRGKRQSETKKT